MILNLLGLSWVRYAIAAIGIGSLVGGFALSQQNKGAVKAVAKIEKANDHASKIGRSAAAKSTADGVRGQRDPYTRND